MAPSICPATGHVVKQVRGPVCQSHGVPWFVACPRCGAGWPTTFLGYSDPSGQGADFCASCGTPGPWLPRARLVEWVQHQLQAAKDLPAAARLELRDMLDRLKGMDPDDT